MKRRLFALCIGINDYQLPDAPLLQKATHDAQALKAHLLHTASNAWHTVSVHSLIGAEATRHRIIQEIKQHLSKVNESDTALFYFSGLGTAEALPESLQELVPDNRLNGLLCHPPADDFSSDLVLLHRELDFLLREVAESCERVVRVFDCAHREPAALPSDLSAKHWSFLHPARSWEDYAWGYTFSEEEALPYLQEQLTANQVSLRADAFEDESEVYSLFTKFLLSALHSTQGSISYANLAEAIQSAIAHRWAAEGVSPNVRAESLSEEVLAQSFLL